jgi:hypothetical protein
MAPVGYLLLDGGTKFLPLRGMLESTDTRVASLRRREAWIRTRLSIEMDSPVTRPTRRRLTKARSLRCRKSAALTIDTNAGLHDPHPTHSTVHFAPRSQAETERLQRCR